ncbi:helix-turn-helix domain-containing protein [Staphylococcus hominis]|jgi:transcriptional regulator with XRE-family HTH domain|uniref:helix-turn-helix domain-containing protein n=1 Tax=Staphylococcus hominis TaxID=1290 RepID=UPI0003819668|nr:helix-turn-helix transcriptional regulator [Staphylococcus hominis]
MDRNYELKLQISTNIRKFMKAQGLRQLDLANKSGISRSTISDYLNNKTLINPENVQKIANALNVNKSDIDPSFKSQKNQDTMAAHLDYSDLTEDEQKEVEQFIQFIRNRNK